MKRATWQQVFKGASEKNMEEEERASIKWNNLYLIIMSSGKRQHLSRTKKGPGEGEIRREGDSHVKTAVPCGTRVATSAKKKRSIKKKEQINKKPPT